MRRNIAVIGLLSCLVSCLGVVLAQDEPDPRSKIEKMIVDGLAAFRERADDTCVDLLQKAISRINELSATGLGAILPKEFPEEFEADEAKRSTGTWGSGANTVQWRSITQHWTRESDGARITVTASNSPQIVKTSRAGFDIYTRNPQLKAAMAAQGIEISEKEGFGIMVSDQNGRPSGQVFGKTLMIQIQLSKGDKKIVTDAIDGLDWAALKKADERK